MAQLFFIGSPTVFGVLQAALKGYAQVVSAGSIDSAQLCICEIASVQDISKVPTKLNVPLFLFINTKDKSALEMIRKFRISGIFYPPVDGEALKRKIESTLARAVAPQAEAVEDFEKIKVKILAKAESIPMLPLVVHKLIAMTGRDDTTIGELTSEIKKDQGISSRIIRMVNSPFFVVAQQVNSIDRAVVLLGFQTLKNTALAASTGSYYNKLFKMYKTTGNVLWTHAYTVAVLCEALAQEAKVDADMLYLAGLFHDIGKTITVDFLVKEVSNLADEREQVGMDHAEVGALVVRRWQLADEIVDAIRLHHAPDEAIHTRILYHANRLAHGAKLGDNIIQKVFSGIFEDIKVADKDRTAFMQRLLKLAETSEEIVI